MRSSTKIHADRLVAAAAVLRDGGVALLPTDTVYGLAVSPLSESAIDRLFQMKGRPRTRNLPIMVADVSALDALGVDLNDAARRLIASPLVPGPLTLALGFRDGPAVEWLAGRDEIAVRIPADDALRTVLELTGPLLVTSANMHAQETAELARDVLESLHGVPDIVIDGGPRSHVPSTLVNCRKNPPEVERIGKVPAQEIARILQ